MDDFVIYICGNLFQDDGSLTLQFAVITHLKYQSSSTLESEKVKSINPGINVEGLVPRSVLGRLLSSAMTGTADDDKDCILTHLDRAQCWQHQDCGFNPYMGHSLKS